MQMTNTEGKEEYRESLRQTVRKVARRELPQYLERLDQEHEFVWEIIELYRQQGYYGTIVPEGYGGQGGTISDFCAIVEELAWVDATAAIYLVEPVSTGALHVLLTGNDEQKKRYLPSLSQGTLTAMALTEPQAGSDVASITTQAVRSGDHYVINGHKIYVTLGNVAEYIVVFAVSGPGAGTHGISALIVRRDSPGIEVGRLENKMGFHAKPTAELFFTDVEARVEDRLGAEGDGFKAAMEMFNSSRVFIGALSVGLAQGALDSAIAYIKEREQFGRPIAANQGIQFMVADMQTKIEAARALTYHAAASVERRTPDLRRLAAMSKYFGSDVAMEVTTDAVQLFGGAGYIRDSLVEKKMRDAKLLQIFEGTNQIQRVIIARDLLGRYD